MQNIYSSQYILKKGATVFIPERCAEKKYLDEGLKRTIKRKKFFRDASKREIWRHIDSPTSNITALFVNNEMKIFSSEENFSFAINMIKYT